MNFLTSTTIGYDPLSGAGAPLIAVQKVDVVAHSYGGLLTRWYMEQAANSSGGKLFEDLRNIRSLIEIGTPNLGSPLANMIDEVYSGTSLGKMIANASLPSWVIDTAAFLKFVPSSATTMSGFLAYLQQLGANGLPTTSNGNPYPFYEDDAVNSPLLSQLNAGSPFNNNVSYAAVYGTNPNLPALKWHDMTLLWLDVYPDMQPMGPNGQSYFPWLQILDGASNDSIVPTWSATLPDLSYDKPVNTDHIDLEANATTEADVLAFLANPNLPLGSAEAAAAGTSGWSAPVSDQNAYSGGTNSGPSTEVSGAGLNPAAIVGVRLDGTDYNTTTWDAYKNAGAQYPVFTGMVRVSQLTTGVNFSYNASYVDITGGAHSTSLGAFYLYGQGQTNGGNYLFVAPQYLQGAGPSDWVPFSISTLALGRGAAQSISSPYTSQPFAVNSYANISYTLNGVDSASTALNVPAYTPPAPLVNAPNAQNQVMVTLNGAYQVQPSGSGSYADVKLYADGGLIGSDTLLAEYQFNDLNPPNVSVYWVGLAITYSQTVTLTLSNYTLTGPLGSANWDQGLFQELNQSVIGTLDSGDAYVPGS